MDSAPATSSRIGPPRSSGAGGSGVTSAIDSPTHVTSKAATGATIRAGRPAPGSGAPPASRAAGRAASAGPAGSPARCRSHRGEHVEHLVGLHALRHDREAEVVAELDDRPDDGGVRCVDRRSATKPCRSSARASAVWPGSRGGVALAEVVDADPHAGGAEPAEACAGPVRVGQQRGLGDLQDQPVRAAPRVASASSTGRRSRPGPGCGPRRSPRRPAARAPRPPAVHLVQRGPQHPVGSASSISSVCSATGRNASG